MVERELTYAEYLLFVDEVGYSTDRIQGSLWNKSSICRLI